jgi:3'-phosphoadenosine 5'-phosphosulfate sulfotransferase (PAPS reductase)/FAD synthetase
MDPAILTMHARLAGTAKRWDRARRMVAGHLGRSSQSYTSWSGGKDSTAVALLVDELDPAVPVVRRSRGVDFPEVVIYCQELADRFGWTYRVATGDTLETFAARMSLDHAPSRTRHLAEAANALGYDPTGWLYGLRQDESPDRRKLLTSTRGAWRGASGHEVCAPLWQWSRLDVLAYLHHRGVGPCPVYDRLEQLGCPDRDQRVGYMVGSGGAHSGRYVWLRRGWPDQFEQLAQQLPWLRDVS